MLCGLVMVSICITTTELLLANFYRATLCVSAVIAVARCPSVYPSDRMFARSCILSKWLKISSNFFVRPVVF